MFRIVVACRGLTDQEAKSAPADILGEFTRRPWYESVKCNWDGTVLHLEAANDYDKDGLALLDEFSDVVVACVRCAGDLSFEIESVDVA